MKLPKDIIEKAQLLVTIRRMRHTLEKQEEELAGVLRLYVGKRGKENQKGQKAVWNELLEIFLEPNPRVEISPLGIFQLLKKEVWDFLAVRKTELEKARKEKRVDLSDEQMEKISQKSDGTPRVKVEIKATEKHPRGLVLDQAKGPGKKEGGKREIARRIVKKVEKWPKWMKNRGGENIREDDTLGGE